MYVKNNMSNIIRHHINNVPSYQHLFLT